MIGYQPDAPARAGRQIKFVATQSGGDSGQWRGFAVAGGSGLNDQTLATAPNWRPND